MEPIKMIPLVSGQVEEWANGCEQYAVHLTYDLRETLEKWPDAMPSVAFERADGKKYPHAWRREEDVLHIPLTKADTAIAGLCKCVILMVSGDGQHNSDVFHGRVSKSIDTLDEEPTDPQLGIIEQVNGAAVRAETAAESASDAVAGIDETTEEKKAEIVQTAEEQMERLKSSEVVEDLVKDAIAEFFEGNEITAEAIGAASAEALQDHEENKENPHAVTAEQVGAASKDAFNTHAESKENPHGVTADQVKAAPSVHSSQHSAGGSDPITPEAIEAAAAVHASRHSAGGSDPISPEAIDALPAVEDVDHPGCYYRMVDGVKEWINPPMVIGVEYRTTKRHEEKPVYTKAISCGAAPQTSQKSIAHNSKNARMVDYSISAQDGTVFPYISSSGNRVEGYATANYVFLHSTYNTQAFTEITATIWYFKTTD